MGSFGSNRVVCSASLLPIFSLIRGFFHEKGCFSFDLSSTSRPTIIQQYCSGRFVLYVPAAEKGFLRLLLVTHMHVPTPSFHQSGTSPTWRWQDLGRSLEPEPSSTPERDDENNRNCCCCCCCFDRRTVKFHRLLLTSSKQKQRVWEDLERDRRQSDFPAAWQRAAVTFGSQCESWKGRQVPSG